jgi:hypothetical protein
LQRKNLADDPHSVDLVLALSKAEASQRQYREAIDTCMKGIACALGNADLYLEGGHRELACISHKQSFWAVLS